MNSKISLQKFKIFFLIQSLFVLPLLAPKMASAAIDIKDTNYQIPINAYFVSPDGRDNNSGRSPSSPWPVEKAINSAPSGATIVFRGGTYRNVDVQINKNLTLQAYPHEKPLLKGSIEVTGWVADGSTWRKDAWNYSFPPSMGNEYIDPEYPMAGHRDMVYINGDSLRQVGSKARVTPGTFYVDYANNKLYIGNNPAGKTVEATAQEVAFNLLSNRNASPSGTVVRGLGFAHYAESGIELMKTHSVTLENNTFVWNGVRGVHFKQSAAPIVRGNTFSYNGMHGIRGSWADRMLLEGNTISYNNIEHFRKNWTAAGIKLIKTDDVVWRNNLLEHNVGSGMWLDHSSTNATITNNTVRDNETIGIMFELSHKAIVTGNVINNNAAGIMIADSSNAQVHNNILSGNRKSILLKDSPRRNNDQSEIARGIAWITRNNVIRDNRISG